MAWIFDRFKYCYWRWMANMPIYYIIEKSTGLVEGACFTTSIPFVMNSPRLLCKRGLIYQSMVVRLSTSLKVCVEWSWLRVLVGSALDHRSLPPEFESRGRHIWRVFHLWLRFITFGGRSAHLAYHVHKSSRKTSIIIILADMQGTALSTLPQ